MSQLRIALRSAAWAIAVAAIYFAAGKLGLRLAFVNASATSVWPPTGIAIAALLLLGYRVWPGILLGAFLVNLTTAGTVATSIGIAFGNTAEGLIAAFLVRRFANGAHCFDRPADVFRFTALAAVLSTTVSATIGVGTLMLGGLTSWPALGATWMTWWLGDLAGALVVAPVLLLWGASSRPTWTAERVMEVLLLLTALVGTSLLVFGDGRHVPALGHLPESLCAPLLLWTAFRFGGPVSATLVAVLSGVATVCTLRGTGPFAQADPNASLLLLQAFVVVWSVATLALAAAAEERRRVAARMRHLNEALEQHVVERTKRLRAINEELILQIEERARAEEQLRQSEVRLREAQEVARIGSWEWDVDQNVVWWSPVLYAIYGVDPASFGASYRSYLDCVHPDDRERVDRIVREACRDARGFSYDHRIVRPDGGVRTLHARGHSLTNSAGRTVRMIGTGQDVTEREQREEERTHWIHEQAARREAERANQLKDEFLAVLSHELRNPLNAIVMWSRLLRDGKLDAAETEHAIEAIARNAQVQNRLVHDLLDLSRLNSGKLELRRRPLNPARVVEAALETMRPLAEARRVVLEARHAGGWRPVLGDPERLQQVIWNLVSNAIHFTAEGGRVVVSLESREGEVVLRVEDDGPGIHPEILPVVFDAVRRGDKSQPGRSGGLGLGLAIVRRLAELHGGRAEAANRTGGRGAEFTVTLPSLDPDQPLPVDSENGEEGGHEGNGHAARSLHGTRVMIVEDDLDSAEALAMLLARNGARVVVAENCAAAVAQFKSQPPQVLISDIALPDGDGYELLDRLRAGNHGGDRVPAIALTAYAGAEHSRRALESGYQVHIAKPFDADHLIGAVASLADGDAAVV